MTCVWRRCVATAESCWYSDRDVAIGYINGDHGVCSDDAIVSDVNRSEDTGARTEPHARSDGRRREEARFRAAVTAKRHPLLEFAGFAQAHKGADDDAGGMEEDEAFADLRLPRDVGAGQHVVALFDGRTSNARSRPDQLREPEEKDREISHRHDRGERAPAASPDIGAQVHSKNHRSVARALTT